MSSEYRFRRYQPLSLRMWHWLNMLVILVLLATVLLRKTFLSWRTNSALIESKLKENGMMISPDLPREIAVQMRDAMWDWHIYFGFALGALLLGRIFIALFVEKRSPFGHAIQSALGLKRLPLAARSQGLHYTLVRAGYAFFYLAVAFMVVTGILMTFQTEIGLSKSFASVVKETHELAMWFFVVFVSGHIVGLVIAENRGDAGIVSDMIHGGDKPGGVR